MSGFIAIVNTNDAPVDRQLLEKLTASLHYRGPDNQSVWVNNRVGLGHALFRTTDEALYESQPATLDRQVWITGSMRIDARKELVDKLDIARNIRLSQTPDSELLLYAYRAWGEKCLGHILGDFAFVLWDNERQKLFCAIDRFGIKQLYYARIGDVLVVCNCMRSIRQYPAISKKLNDEAIGNFLLLGDHRWVNKSQTCFSDIQTLQPAHYLVLEGKNICTQRYWNISDDLPLLQYRNDSEYLEHFQEIFKAAVSDRIRSPSAVISLSGGIDSSSIAAIIRRLQKMGSQPVNLGAVTVLYDSIHPSDERYYVDLISRSLNLAPHYIDGGKYPFLSPSVTTTRPIEQYQPALWLDVECKALSMGRVMLAGYAGDNLMAFSSVLRALKEVNPVKSLMAIYRLRKLYSTCPTLGTGLLGKFNRLLGKGENAPFSFPCWINPEFEKKLELKNRWAELWASQAKDSHSRHPKVYQHIIEPDWNTDDIYLNCDSTLPEKRDPFLDLRMLEFVLSLPALPWLYKKHLLRSSIAREFPADVVWRPKTTIGSIHCSLLRVADNTRVNKWSAQPELAQFVDRKKIPMLKGGIDQEDALYVNLRPLLLNNWLMGLSK